jgi:hypothetical protein
MKGSSDRPHVRSLSGSRATTGIPAEKLQDIFHHFTQADFVDDPEARRHLSAGVRGDVTGEIRRPLRWRCGIRIVAMTASTMVRGPAPLSGRGNGPPI